MKYIVLTLINICIIQFLNAQQVYLGLPVDQVEISSNDIVLIEEIAWQGNYNNFNEIGLKQVENLNAFLGRVDSLAIEFGIHCNYGGSETFNFRVSESIAKKLQELLDKEIVGRVKFVCWGNTSITL